MGEKMGHTETIAQKSRIAHIRNSIHSIWYEMCICYLTKSMVLIPTEQKQVFIVGHLTCTSFAMHDAPVAITTKRK